MNVLLADRLEHKKEWSDRRSWSVWLADHFPSSPRRPLRNRSISGCYSPPGTGGVAARSKRYCEATLVRADGVVRPAKSLGLNSFAERTTPSAAIQWLRDILIYAAATPPMLGGEYFTAVAVMQRSPRRDGEKTLLNTFTDS